MNREEYRYLDLLDFILEFGNEKEDRTGTGTRSVFGRQIRFDLSKGFPLLTTKKVHLRAIIYELLWFLSGSTNAKWLEDHNVNIWREWGDPETRELGPVYGKQWRSWPTGKKGKFIVTDRAPNGEACEGYQPDITIDQIAQIIDSIKNNPDSRRHIVSAWNVAMVEDMALPPCHCLFQFYVADGKLSCQLYQRSADIFLGVPFNIASYALLTMMVAQQCGLEPGEFIHTFGDIHLYNNHVEQAKEQLLRMPHKFPVMRINKAEDIFSYSFEDFELINYTFHPAISAPVAV